MREKQRGPDNLAKTSCSYQINMFLTSAIITTIGARTKPTLNAVTSTVITRPIPVVNKPTIRPAITNIPIIVPITFTIVAIVTPPYNTYLYKGL